MAERDREGLLAAIREEPDDDLPRLALADWLDEHGGDGERAWARLIRVQCEHARRVKLKNETGEEDGIDRLEKEGKQIIRQNEGTLFAGLPVSGRFLIEYRRGMPESVVARAGRYFLKDAAQAFAVAPITDVLVKQVTVDDMENIYEAGWLERIRALRLVVRCHDLVMALIANQLATADVSGMRALEIYHDAQEDPAPCEWAAMLSYGRWTGLRRLVISTQGVLSARIVRGFRRAPGLEELSLHRVAPEAVRELAAGFPELRTLAFNSSALTNEAAEALAGAKRLARLRQLDLTNRGTPLTDPAALVRLLTSPALADLTALRLTGPANPIGDFSAVRHAKKVRSATLRVLHLHHFEFSAADAAALVRLPSLHGLTTLSLGDNRLGGEGAAAIAAVPWERLTRLNLNWCGIDDRGVQALAASPSLSNLRHLELYSNPIGPDAALAIARSPYLGGLCSLTLPPEVIQRGAAELKRRFGRKGWRGVTFTRPE